MAIITLSKAFLQNAAFRLFFSLFLVSGITGSVLLAQTVFPKIPSLSPSVIHRPSPLGISIIAEEKVNKAWLGVAGQLFSGFPQLPLVTHRQLVPVFSPTGEWAEGREEEWRCFHCVFYDLSLTAPIVARPGIKEKGSQMRRAASWIDQSPHCGSQTCW